MNKKISIVILILSIIFLKNTIFANETSLSGFVLDQTKTRVGREFYEDFAKVWQFPPGMEDKNIIITEMTDPRWGSMIIIYVDEVAVYSTMLKPRLEDIEEKVDDAQDAVLNYFMFLIKQKENLKEESKFW